MAEKKSFYITTTLPYVNSDPHIGFALEIVTADVIARYKRALGYEVVFNTGTDEHGQKIYQKALESEVEVQAYVDKYAKRFSRLEQLLSLSITNFIRTTDEKHIRAAQEFWKRCDSAGDIYKKLYTITYCVGCELEKQASELVDGKCPLHPNQELEIREEENYFFKFSHYQDQLLELYTTYPEFVVPVGKLKEIQAFVQQGLQDFSISRLKDKMPWGVPVPGDAEHVMYVWFDALVNYISTLGWPDDDDSFLRYWPGVQIAGKDNLRQQSAMWQAMLLSAGLPTSKQILINGFISVEGQKMSKSLGNVIAPQQMIENFGIDGARYLLLKLGPVHEDMDVSLSQFSVTYNADLANGLGNSVARVASLCERSGFDFPSDTPPGFRSELTKIMDTYRFDLALEFLWQQLRLLDQRIEEKRPWKLSGSQLETSLREYVAHLRQIAYELQPFLPSTSEKVLELFKGPKIAASSPLFPRIEG